MVVTEEIMKCWMCSDRPITLCLITGTLPKGYSQHPLCERCATKIDDSYPYGWDQNEIVELIDLREYERYKDFKDELCGNVLKEMCIYIRYSMSIIEKVFHYEEKEITVIKYRDEIWFRGKDIAKALGYEKTRNAILKHVNDDDKSILEDLRRGPQIRAPFKNEQGGSIFINESGLYSLIFGSKLESAKAFKRWVTKDVLPSIRKTGRYDYCIDHKYNNTLTFKIESKTDLHVKVVSFLKKRYPHSLFSVTLGENQNTVHKRIDSFKKEYIRGSPDLIINNLHKNYTSFASSLRVQKEMASYHPISL